VRDPAADPGGHWVVVAAMRDGHSDLYRIDVPTGVDTRLTNNPEGNFAPAVLDAQTIVFTSSRDGDSELYRMPVAGGDATRLTAFHRDDWAPTPSPDGKRIAFVSDREGTPRIFVMSATGTDLRRLTERDDDREESEPAWSPDGKLVAYVAQSPGGAVTGTQDPDRGRSDVHVHELASGTERRITPSSAGAASNAGAPIDVSPVFSPDGAYLLVSRQPPDGATFDLWVIPLAGGEQIRVTHDIGDETIPRWLPD
jgi:TolB protein